MRACLGRREFIIALCPRIEVFFFWEQDILSIMVNNKNQSCHKAIERSFSSPKDFVYGNKNRHSARSERNVLSEKCFNFDGILQGKVADATKQSCSGI